MNWTKDKLKNGYDIVIVARTAAKDKNYWEISDAFMHLARKKHLIVESEES